MKQLLSVRSGRRDLQRSERGAVTFLVAITVLILMLVGAVAVDLSVVSTRGQDLQNAADAAALAGVQAYRESGGDKAAAQTAVDQLLEQNGLSGGSTSFVVSFPDVDNETEVTVSVTDNNPGTLLSGVTGVDSEVERSATAQFVSCEASCTVEVAIPEPFRSVSAAGTGDGYKPIAVGSRLYALNHSSSYGGIVCIDREKEDQGACWESGISRPAYATGPNSQRNPEMPHTAVFDTKIYWTASDSAGTKVFCFETLTGTPCFNTFLLNSRTRASSAMHYKDRNRGGGTVLFNDRVYAFSDDFRVHCVVPDTGAGMQSCPGYAGGGLPSALALDNFPENDPVDGNHGSSIDRVVDEETGRLYWTTHISNAVATCDADNLEFPSGVVSIQNAWSSNFLRVPSSGSDISSSTTNDLEDTHFTVEPTTDGRFVFRSLSRTGRVLDSDWSSGDAPLETSSGVSDDDKWQVNFLGQTSTIESDYGTFAGDNGTDFVTNPAPFPGERSHWIIRHPDCFDVGFTPGPTPTLPYDEGTWLQCWDAVSNTPCAGFTPSRIHSNSDRFSGRLFFHYDGAADPNIQGVCSSGFNGSLASANFEINCVGHLDGLVDAGQTSNMAPFATQIAAVTDSSPAAWGDPHYNEDTNRLFYPSAHDISRVLCWDFDYGYCDSMRAASPLGWIEDYGFFSEGDCVYGLGHNAYFYAFQAEDIFSVCTGATTRTNIQPCECSGTWEWGALTFDIDLAGFDEFLIQVFNSEGDLVYPNPAAYPAGTDHDDIFHSVHDDGVEVNLAGLPVSADPDNDFLEIVVKINAEGDPWAAGEQTFVVEFSRAPRLTD